MISPQQLELECTRLCVSYLLVSSFYDADKHRSLRALMTFSIGIGVIRLGTGKSTMGLPIKPSLNKTAQRVQSRFVNRGAKGFQTGQSGLPSI